MKILLILATISTAKGMAEIDPALGSLAPGATSNIMVTMTNGTDSVLQGVTSRLDRFGTRADRLNAVHDALVAHAALTQAPVLAALTPFLALIKVTPYWVSNQIFIVGATAAVIKTLSVLPSIGKIEPEFFIKLDDPSLKQHGGRGHGVGTRQSGTNTYGVVKIKAPEVWDLGYTGQGVIVGHIDGGVNRDHDSLKGRFLGEHGWYDPYLFSAQPNELLPPGHGTHTMGTITGTGGIGVAPGATWASCRGCLSIECSNNQLTACGQFFTCPFEGKINGPTSEDCSKAPHVISNSWGGGQGDSFYNPVISAWKACGIIPVFAAGNSGPDCETANSPGDQADVITVGATDANDALADFSSVGPSQTDGLIKPDIAAPGVNTISALNLLNNQYQSMSGTSMATPHVAGVVALLLSKDINLTYDQIYTALTQTTDQSTLVGINQVCGGLSDTDWPNNSFGWGRVNALRAIQSVGCQ